MLKLASYDIVFQEIPGEVTLALNLSGCPNRCPGCHSPHLRRNTGQPLDEELLGALLDRYKGAATCVCFMGGDADPREVERLAVFVWRRTGQKTGWYSGKPALPAGISASNFNYIKLGPYVEKLGGLDSPSTNQRFYRVSKGVMTDVTGIFTKKTGRL